VGWEPGRGPQAAVGTLRSAADAIPDLRSDTVRVLRAAADGSALIIRARGHDPVGGGAAEMVFGQVSIFRAGRLAHMELFDPADEAAMVACLE